MEVELVSMTLLHKNKKTHNNAFKIDHEKRGALT